jgi:hypothetical protein
MSGEARRITVKVKIIMDYDIIVVNPCRWRAASKTMPSLWGELLQDTIASAFGFGWM